MRTKIIALCLFIQTTLIATPFKHDLNLNARPGHGTPIVCMHGYGGSGEMLLDFLKIYCQVQEPLIGFNFPDFDIYRNSFDPDDTQFGTIQELLPPLYVMKKCVIDEGMDALSLYGFSAGGGAVINCLKVLNTDGFDSDLESIGIGKEEKKNILDAIQKGVILLDAPLKSMEEITAYRPDIVEFTVLSERYIENNLRPIDSLREFSGLALNILLYFQSPDEILSNRDDDLFIDILKEANVLGNTEILIADTHGHNTIHTPLWEANRRGYSNSLCPHHPFVY